MRKWGFVIRRSSSRWVLLHGTPLGPSDLWAIRLSTGIPWRASELGSDSRPGNIPQCLAPTERRRQSIAWGRPNLRFTNFKTSSGPDVHVYMVAADDAEDHATFLYSDLIDLGVIQGNIGDRNYSRGRWDLPKYHTVSACCKRFRVNFENADLTPDHTLSRK